MILGSTEYDDSEDSDFDRPKKKTRTIERTSTTLQTRAEEIKNDGRLLNKIDAMEKRARSETRQKRKSVSSANKQKKLKVLKEKSTIVETSPPTNKITNYTSTSSHSSSSKASSVVSTTRTLGGYNINPMFTSSMSTKELLKQHHAFIQSDPNELCRGCNSIPSECANRTYRNDCFHAVIDYYDQVGFHFTDDGIKKAYMSAYRIAARRDMCKLTSYYEMSSELQLPRCMEVGSLRQSVEMLNGHRRFTQIMKQRVFNIQDHLKRTEKKIKDEIEDIDNSD